MEIEMDTPNVGGWYPISDLEGKLVVMAAKLAVEEHNNRNNLNLSFVSVVSGRVHMVEGSVYHMVIAVTDGGAARPKKNYEVEVWLRPWLNNHDKCILDSFKQIDNI